MVWIVAGWVVWSVCALLALLQVVAWYSFARAGKESAFPLGVQALLWLALVVAFLLESWSKLHLLWCFPLAYLAGLFIPMFVVAGRLRGVQARMGASMKEGPGGGEEE
jgi:Kef-type K+ transport system membrane component KefB